MKLQRGNLVYENRPEGKKIIQVETISKFLINGIGISAIEPIPLTEEWLLRFGFEKELDGFYRKNKSGIIEFCFYDNGILATTQSVCLSHFKYVHQLQNLYFSLTNNELTIKL